MGTATVRNAQDTWIDENAKAKRFQNKAQLFLKAGSNVRKRSLLYFTKPWPAGATIISAKLRVYNFQTWAGSNTLTVFRATSKWGINTVNWNDKPTPDAIPGLTATMTKSGAAAGTLWDIDVTALVQEVANGAAWYGFVVATNATSDRSMHAAQSAVTGMRPSLEVVWTMAPGEPDDLKPAAGRSISLNKPLVSFDYNDPTGDESLSSVQVQFAATEANANAGASLLWDSGEQASSLPYLDLNTAVSTAAAFVGTSYPGLASGATTWWRVRAKDDAGLWSVWSDAVSFVRTAKGSLTITLPTGANVWDGGPTVTWTFTGTTQRAYRVFVVNESDMGTPIWNSGKITSAATSVQVPFGLMPDDGSTYRIYVRIYDSVSRESVPGDPAYVEAYWSGTFAQDSSVAEVTSFAVNSDVMLPVMHLTWARSAEPDYWHIQRSDDSGVTWKFIEEFVGSALSAGGTNYAYDDVTASPRTTYAWRVLAVVGGRMSGDNPVQSSQIRRLAPFLMRPNMSDLITFANAKRTRAPLDIQDIHEPMAGPPVLVTQHLGGLGGHLEGRFIDDMLTGVTAKTLYDRFKRLRRDSGQKFILYTANETYTVVTYNMQHDVLVDASGVTYFVSFDWIEQ